MSTSEIGPAEAKSVISAGAVLVATTALAMVSRVIARWTMKTLGVDDSSFPYYT